MNCNRSKNVFRHIRKWIYLLLIEEILLWTLPSRVALAAEMNNYEDKEKNNKNSGENYVTELEWSQMEADLMEGNTVEWILSSFLGGQAENDEEYSLEPNWRIHLSQEELTLMERCVMAEGGGESYECQVAIACVIVNRVLSESFPDTLTEVVTQSGQFSTWPNGIRCVNVTDSVRQAVREALTRAVYPEKILYFRANRYHEWGTAYCRIDNTYFSTP